MTIKSLKQFVGLDSSHKRINDMAKTKKKITKT